MRRDWKEKLWITAILLFAILAVPTMGFIDAQGTKGKGPPVVVPLPPEKPADGTSVGRYQSCLVAVNSAHVYVLLTDTATGEQWIRREVFVETKWKKLEGK